MRRRPRRKPRKSRLIDQTFIWACKRNDRDKVVEMLRDGYKPNEHDLPYLADAIARKFTLRRGQHRNPRIDPTGRIARYAAGVAREEIARLRRLGLTARDKVRDKAIASAMALLEYEAEEGTLKGVPTADRRTRPTSPRPIQSTEISCSTKSRYLVSFLNDSLCALMIHREKGSRRWTSLQLGAR